MAQVRAKKYLGQHFLRDLEIARRIAESLPLREAMPVLEIGPGTGVLTRFLLENPLINLTAVEIDRESVDYLHIHYPTLKLIEGDFLKMDLNVGFALRGNSCKPRRAAARSSSLRFASSEMRLNSAYLSAYLATSRSRFSSRWITDFFAIADL